MKAFFENFKRGLLLIILYEIRKPFVGIQTCIHMFRAMIKYERNVTRFIRGLE